MTGGAVKKSYKFLASTELAVVLFLIVSLVAIPGTFLENREVVYKNPFFLVLLALLGLNLVLCTVRRIRTISRPVLILHGGVLLTLVGCILTSFGFVGTVNIYEDTSIDQVYRWDLQRDVPLGMELNVRRVNREYYPVPVKVGVLRGQEKVSLHTLRTGESFTLGEFEVLADDFDVAAQVLRLTVMQAGRVVGTCDTAGAAHLPPEFPYRFKLVAFRDPVLKRLWVDILLSAEGAEAKGVAEVNHPFTWRGLHFYNTQVARDEQGRTYAGIQVVKDPGRPLVFAGFAVMCIGVVLCFIRRFSRKNLWN
ncbi:ResB-like family cytochrome C biogenesis protein [Geobacter sp. DSM 9736]|uniref:ResB-like family cytochrome C biogenesis protein n=1 Tax=Geobacter sp. DSM 9736 TaxID=1277350 RepID=UPI000B503149|nr:ResB-like family cytochrome C biogenesis protein [Geobacter sp. DSM 9736]SNB47462.1 ResB-like family protein [Geobacter sp. DSM 9736]